MKQNKDKVLRLHAEVDRLIGLQELSGLESLYQEILSLDPNDVKAVNGLGVLAYLAQDFDRAITQFQKAVTIDPASAQYHLNLAKVWLGKKNFAETEKACRLALRIEPHSSEVRRHLGWALFNLFRYEDALSEVDKVLAMEPNAAEFLLLKGKILTQSHKFNESNKVLQRLLEVHPNSGDAWFALATNYFLQENVSASDAVAAISQAIRCNPSDPNYFTLYGHKLIEWSFYELAAEVFQRAHKLQPGINFSLGYSIYCRMLVGDWEGLSESLAEASLRLKNGEQAWEPFGFKAIAHSEAEQQASARIFSQTRFPYLRGLIDVPKHRPHPKIRVGYLAGEFRQHATSILMTGVFELHDKNRFEVYAFDNGWNDGSKLRGRQNAAFHQIIDIHAMPGLEAAKLIAAKEIDILIDLNGFFGSSRQDILAFKPSPIQVSYLGCPGTMGTDYIDYLIADSLVIPDGSDKYYDEKIVRMPYAYQANDRQREVSERVFTRAEMGLPEHGFVFCCFNNNYKILPATFAQWMRILQKVEGSVLWLFENCAEAIVNLRREAEKRGVHPDRLVFAKPLPPPEHLARHILADLFLDTLPYNAHTTASDALWMGLPLVTLVGATFPGRVASSLLQALDVPELVTHTAEAYEALAVELAMQPEKLKALREKILAHRQTKPLFNTEQFTRHFEQALQAMYQRHQAGLQPEAITIKK